VNPHKVILEEMKRDGYPEIFELLRKGVRETNESTHVHSHCQVLPFNGSDSFWFPLSFSPGGYFLSEKESNQMPLYGIPPI